MLAGNLACNRAVDLVGEPVFAGYSLEREYVGEVLVEIGLVGVGVAVCTFYGNIVHHSLGRVAEHVIHGQVDGFVAVAAVEYKAVVAGGFAHYIERGTLALSYGFDVGYFVGVNNHAHAFLAFVAYDFLCREGGVAYGQGIDVDFAACGFHEFTKGVQVAACSVVVY